MDPFRGSASEVSRSGADVQVVTCHFYPVILDHFIEQLMCQKGMYSMCKTIYFNCKPVTDIQAHFQNKTPLASAMPA